MSTFTTINCGVMFCFSVFQTNRSCFPSTERAQPFPDSHVGTKFFLRTKHHIHWKQLRQTHSGLSPFPQTNVSQMDVCVSNNTSEVFGQKQSFTISYKHTIHALMAIHLYFMIYILFLTSYCE